MAEPRLVIRVAGSVEELKRNIGEGLNQIEALRAGVDRYVKSFDGTKVIQNANNIVAAVEKIGGASKLTEAEQARVNATLDKALEKYRALGKDAPPAMQALYDATKKVESASGGAEGKVGLLGGSVAKLAAGFALGGLIDKGIGTIISLGKEAFDAAGQIVDLSKKTGLSTTAVQQMGFAANQSGSSLDKWSDVIFKAGLNIEKGSKDAKAGIAGLGLEYDRIRAMAPEQQFDAIMRALANVESPQQRNLLGVQALGKGYTDVAAAVDDYVEMIAKAPVASEGAIQATDAAADAIGRAWDSAKATAINAIGTIFLALEDAKKQADEAGQSAQGRAQSAAMSAVGVNPFALRFGAALGNRLSEGPAMPVPAGPSGLSALAPSLTSAESALQAFNEAYGLTEALLRKNIKSWEEQSKAIEANRSRVESLVRAYTGAALQDEIKAIDESVTKAGKSTGVSADQFWQLSRRLVEIKQAGGQLTPQLQNIAIWTETATATVQRQAAQTQFNTRVTGDWTKALGAHKAVQLQLPPALADQEVEQQRLNQALAEALGITSEMDALGVADRINAEADATQRLAQRLSDAAQMAGALAGATDGALATFAEYTAQGLDAFASFASGDIVGGVTKTITMIGNLARELRPVGAKVNDLRDEFLESAGGAEALYTQLERIGRLDLWDPLMAGPANIEAIESAIRQTEDAIAATDDAMARFGLTFDDVGTITERQTRSVDKLIADYKLLEKAGFSVGQMASGSADRLNALIASALQTGQKLPEALRPYINELIKSGGLTDELRNKLLGVADPAPWQAMEQAAQKYGISFKDLGAQFEQAKLNDQAKDLAADWEMFAKNGTDVNVVIGGMKDEVIAMILQAQKLGLSLPENMKPIIDAMDKAGELTDDNGEKLEGLGDLKYTEPLISDTDKLIAKLDELIEKITGNGGVVDALGAAMEGGFRTPDPSAGFSTPQAPRAHSGAIVNWWNGVQKYHSGSAKVLPFRAGLATDEFPAILQSGEAVLNRRAVQAIGEPTIAAMNRGGRGAGGTFNVAYSLNVNVPTGADPAEVRRAVEQALKRNEGELRNLVKKAANG